MLRLGDDMSDKEWYNSEEYQKLVEKENEYRDKKEDILKLRTKIFNKLNLDDEDKNNIVELIHNVVHWREINMSEVKTKLQMSFSPELKQMLENKIGDVE